VARPWLFSSLVLALGCVPPPPAVEPPTPHTARILVAENRFAPAEFLGLVTAAERLRVATGGRVDLEIVPGASWGQIRRHDLGDPQVDWADDHFHATVYGWTDADLDIHLVPGRLPTSRAFVHTAMHELLHAIGVHHTSGNARAIMAPSSDASDAPLVITAEDRIAIAEALHIPAW